MGAGESRCGVVNECPGVEGADAAAAAAASHPPAPRTSHDGARRGRLRLPPAPPHADCLLVTARGRDGGGVGPRDPHCAAERRERGGVGVEAEEEGVEEGEAAGEEAHLCGGWGRWIGSDGGEEEENAAAAIDRPTKTRVNK